MDPDAVLAATRAETDDGPVILRLASEAEIEEDELARTARDAASEGRWVAFRSAEPLPLDTVVTVTIGPELPSAEGPRTSGDASWSYRFHVYGPLQVVKLECERPDRDERILGRLREGDNQTAIDGCYPDSFWGIELSNELDTSGFDELEFGIAPDIPGARFEPYPMGLVVSAAATGRTEYVVTLPAQLKDVYGQTLGEAVEVTFATGEARPILNVPGEYMLVLDPAAEGELGVLTTNIAALEVELYRVEPTDWYDYVEFMDPWREYVYGWGDRDVSRPTPPGVKLLEEEVVPEGSADEIVFTPLDLSEALVDGFGHVIAVVTPVDWDPDEDGPRPQARWVQATHLGIKTARDADTWQVWVTDLRDGSPVRGATVVNPGEASARTDSSGLVTFERGDDEVKRRSYTTATAGADVAMLPFGYPHGPSEIYYSGAYRQSDRMRLLWYVFDDRGIYRPGEEVHVKGWVRPVDWGKGGDLLPPDPELARIPYTLYAPNGEEIASGSMDVTPAGGFSQVFALPTDVELGHARLTLEPAGDWAGHGAGHAIEIAEFRRPEFEVTVQAEAPYYLLGDTGFVEASGAYFSGGALPGADVTWQVSGQATQYDPPGHDEFFFGRVQPRWSWDWYGPAIDSDGSRKTHQGLTDAEGKHRLAVDLDNVVPVSPATIVAEATIEDVNRQAWSAATSFQVHPAAEYVGLRLDKWYTDPGEELEVDVIVVDIDGEVVAGRAVEIAAARLVWVLRGGEYREVEEPAAGCALESADEPVTCALEFDEGGRYRLTAEITDAAGRRNVTEMTAFVSGGDPGPTGEQAESDLVELIPDAMEYQPGDTAELLVRAPFAPAEGLMTLRRSGVISTERFRMEGGSHTLRVPVTDEMLPNVTVQVDLVGRQTRTGVDGQPDPDLSPVPAFASGSIELDVPPLERTLEVSAAARDDELAPGEATEIEVTVVGPSGEPVPGAEVAVVVADEAIISLTDYEVPDPIEAFYQARPAGADDDRSRVFLWLSDPSTLDHELQMTGAGEMLVPVPAAGGGGLTDGAWAAVKGRGADLMVEEEAAAEAEMALGMPMMADVASTAAPPGAEQPGVRLRTDLSPLALFAPDLVTDEDGRTTVELKLPDSVTRYRITAVATDGDLRFGKGEGTLTASLPLAVRPSAPRFLNFGDTFELPVVLQNQTDEELEADVVIRASNLELEGGSEGVGRRVAVPAGDRIEVRFPASAALPGTAVFQAAAFAEGHSDAQMVNLPTWTPATTEAFATYGEIDEGAAVQPVQRPPDVYDEFGGLETTLMSTALGNLADAYLYLRDYDFESSESIASRLVATVALKDVLAAFLPEEQPSAEEIDAAVHRDLSKLAALQNYDGGFGWWSRRIPECGSSPFLTTHVAHALARTLAAGYEPPGEMLQQATWFLDDIDGHMDGCGYSGEARPTTKAYALFTLELLGDSRADEAAQVLAEPGERSVEALGWLLMVLSEQARYEDSVAEIRRQLGNRASEEASTAQFTVSYEEEQGHVVLASNRRADAVALEAMIVDTPESTLIPKLARGLLDHRVKGRWGSTQENGWVLLALNRYFREYEAQEPDFVARAWLADGFVGEADFEGRSADRVETLVPLSYLAPEPTDYTLSKDGPGRLYYRLGLRYAPTDLRLEPMERGFAVSREYDWVDDPDDVKRLADGTYEVRAGERVRVRLAMVADSRRYHVALVDPLPAGLEALNPDLAVTGDLPPDEQMDFDTGYRRGGFFEPAMSVGSGFEWWWPWPWYDHQAFRDERTEAFTNILYPGVYSFTYIARATTPGTFIVPPTKAEELYHPETFGRGATDTVVVR